MTIDRISPQQIPDREDAVDDGLVDDVDLQCMAPDEIQRGNALPGHGENALSADPVQEEAGEEQENPREQGEIIGGVESRMREAEIGGQVVVVEGIGEGGQGMEEDADGSLRDKPCQGKEGKADGQPDPPGNAQQQGLCGACQEHARANAGEDAEDDQILPHEQERYEGNGQPEGEDDGAAAVVEHYIDLPGVRDLEQGKETVRMDKVNQALAMFGMTAVPGRMDSHE